MDCRHRIADVTLEYSRLIIISLRKFLHCEKANLLFIFNLQFSANYRVKTRTKFFQIALALLKKFSNITRVNPLITGPAFI